MKKLRLLTCLAGLALASVVGGCAGINTAAKSIERPAILITEGTFTVALDRVAQALDADVAKGTPPSSDEARRVSNQAAERMQVLVIARLAYDATMGSSADAETQIMVRVARDRTDAAYERLQSKLGAIIGTAPI